MYISNDIKYVGVNDKVIDLFEGQYVVKNGMCYNSYVILDEKIAVMDSVEVHFGQEWLNNIEKVLEGRQPDYLVVHHMEPDHSANISSFLSKYPNAVVVASQKAFAMMQNFYALDLTNNSKVVVEHEVLDLGKHSLKFISAPMVHWPEVMLSYDQTDKVLFSADAFGKFGASDVDDDWVEEARRYYFGIVGKFGIQVKTLLGKASQIDIDTICPLHGPVLTENIGYYVGMYNTWASYENEKQGIVVAYTSVYGNTKKAVEILVDELRKRGQQVQAYDLARTDMSFVYAEAFANSKLVLATTTYNSEIFPFMREFILHLKERGFKNKTVGLIENGSWAPVGVKVMMGMLDSCKNITYTDNMVKIMSALNSDSLRQIEALADELSK